MAKKAWALTIAVLTVLLTSCGTIPTEEKISSTATQTVSFSAGNETESDVESSETESKKREPEKNKPAETGLATEKAMSNKNKNTNTDGNVQSSEKPKKKTSQQTEPPESEPVESRSPKTEQPKTEPNPTQPPVEKPKADESVTQPLEYPEPEPSAPPEPAKPKSIYDYAFDVEAIRQELLAIGTGMGLQIDSTLTPDNSSWGNPVTASMDFQGAALERSLKDYVHSMPDLVTAYGGQPIQTFTIYVEDLGGGSYRFYFLY